MYIQNKLMVFVKQLALYDACLYYMILACIWRFKAVLKLKDEFEENFRGG